MKHSKNAMDKFHEAARLVERLGTAEAAAAEIGVPASTMRYRVRMARKLAIQPAATTEGNAAPAQKKGVGRSFAEFRSEHDKSYIVPKRIREGLATLGEGWEYESAFCRIAGVSPADLNAFRDLFAEHIVVLNREGRRAWAGTPAFAAKMKEVLT